MFGFSAVMRRFRLTADEAAALLRADCGGDSIAAEL
jgi:hypothetical protein